MQLEVSASLFFSSPPLPPTPHRQKCPHHHALTLVPPQQAGNSKNVALFGQRNGTERKEMAEKLELGIRVFSTYQHLRNLLPH